MNNPSQDSSGILLLDKPAGMSSNQALGKAKRLLGVRKAGHAGTLDPFATGLLLCAFGQATKANAYLLKASKTYQATLHLGQATTTGDIEGDVIHEAEVADLNQTSWQQLADQFIGEQLQTPPMYSALKHNGVPLYQLARQGITVERQARSVCIDQLLIQQVTAAQVVFEVHCSTGTYVRTLAEDLAKAAGTVGYLTALRRLSIDRFHLDAAVTLTELEALQRPAAELLPAEMALQHFPELKLTDVQTAQFLQGQTITDAAVGGSRQPSGEAEQYRIVGQGMFLGVGVMLEQGLRPQRLFTTANPKR